MRVLLVAHGFPPAASGGTELYVEALARALRAAGDEVLVLAREADPARPELAIREEEREGLRLFLLNHTFRTSSGFSDTYRNATVVRLAAALIAAERPDVAHIHHLTGLSADLPETFARLAVPTVLTLHDYWMICHRGQLLDRGLHRCAGPLPGGCPHCLGPEAGAASVHVVARQLRRVGGRLPALARAARLATALLGSHRESRPAGGSAAPGRADAMGPGGRASQLATRERARFMVRQLAFPQLLLALSHTLRERFVAFGVPAERLVLHELGIPLGPFRSPSRGGERHPGQAAPGDPPATAARQPLRLGFLGSLMVSKAPDVLLRAFERLHPGEASLRILGGHTPYHGDDSYRRRLAPLLTLPSVRWEGALPHAAVPAALAALDAVVVPSIWLENSPLVIREAFAAGVPVIASDLGGMREMVRDGVDGLLFPPGDVAALHRCLRRLLDEPGLLGRLRSGIAPVEDIAADAARTRELYARARRELPPAGSGATHGRALAAPRASPPSPDRPRLAAVVLHHRTPQDTLLAARSLEASRRPVDDLLIVDNGSADGSAALLHDWLPGATILETGDNLGFSGGCNAGIRVALDRGAELVLLLNSDALLAPDALEVLEEALGDPAVGVVGPLVLARARPDRVATAGMVFDPVTGRMRQLLAGAPTPLAGAASQGVDGVAGCALLVRRTVLERIGLLTEEYFFSFEDLDLCLRARKAGYATVCVLASRAVHEGGRTLAATSPARLYYGARNHLLLARRHGLPAGPLATARRTVTIMALTLAHALFRAGVPRAQGVAAVARGFRDHWRGRYGEMPSPARAPGTVEAQPRPESP
jgi:GT2 family glycosyltransferase/glycosyltransferase involved in cell wall biosynthesis